MTTITTGGLISSDGGSAVTARGVCWSIETFPDIEYNNKTADGNGIGSFISNIDGLNYGTTYNVVAYATNSVVTAYGEVLKFKTLYVNETGNMSDIEGNTYKTVKIGNQWWMTENLKTTKFNDGTVIPLVIDNISWWKLSTPAYCYYDNDEALYKETYGALYNWFAVDAASNNGKNVCPMGWHVPNETEWKIMRDYMGGRGLCISYDTGFP